jgi:hypothetical protein
MSRDTPPDPALPQRLAFVVQLSPGPGGATAGFAGRVSHVVSARSARFTSLEECLAFIRQVAREEGGAEDTSR